MGARTRADLSVLLILFRIERGKGAFRRVGCIELRCDVSGAYVITVPCTVYVIRCYSFITYYKFY